VTGTKTIQEGWVCLRHQVQVVWNEKKQAWECVQCEDLFRAILDPGTPNR
jgi:hypothetical protein